MSDVAVLNLAVDSTQGRRELKSFQGELNNTGKAGDSLLSTLKNIGITVGFTALLKQTFKLKADFESLNSRMKDFFGSKISFDISGSDDISRISRELNVSNLAAKQLLVTIGQYR